jgi:hypothetical protein
VPFPLFWYRQSATSLGHVTSAALYHQRTRAPFEAALPPSLAPMLQVAQVCVCVSKSFGGTSNINASA